MRSTAARQNIPRSLLRGSSIERYLFVLSIRAYGKKIEAITKTRNLKNTKYFMIFFVVSTFRDFVTRNLFLFRFIQVSYFDIRI